MMYRVTIEAPPGTHGIIHRCETLEQAQRLMILYTSGSGRRLVRLSHEESNQLVGVRYCPRRSNEPFPGEPHMNENDCDFRDPEGPAPYRWWEEDEAPGEAAKIIVTEAEADRLFD